MNQIKPSPWVKVSSSSGSLVLLTLLLIAYGVHRWVMMSAEAAPPGSDGGNWLALSLELSGEKVKAANVVYPPLFPALLWFAQWFLPPLTALKVLGLLAAVAVSIPAYLILRTALNPWLASLLAAIFPYMDYHNEVFAWGGYPQLLGTALLLLSVFLLLKGLHTGRIWYYVVAAITVALTVAAHTLAAVQLALSLGVLLIAYSYGLWRNPASQERRFMRLLWLWMVATGILLLALAPLYINTLLLTTGNRFNPHDFKPVEFFVNFITWRPENYMWLVITIVGGIVTGWAVFAGRRLFLAEAVAAVTVAAMVTFLIVREIRSAHLVQVGLLLSVGVLVAMSKRGMIRYLSIAYIIAVLVAVPVFGQYRTQRAFDWYRVVDRQVLEALDWLKENRTPEAIAIANQTPRGGILGWWVEGYAEQPAYHAVDMRWLSFSEEQQQAQIAHRFLSTESKPWELRPLAESYHIRFLLLHKGSLKGNILRTLWDAGFATTFENETMIVLTFGKLRLAP